ncbi:MAG: hypothetical protein QW074_08720 [Candidatus Caldarchaeum sp.]
MSKTSLEKIRDRYADFFELPGDRMVFEKIVELIDNMVDTAVSDIGVITKLMVLSDAERAVEVFADFYRRCIPPTIVNNLAEDLKWVVEKARETATVLWLEGQRK